MFIHKQTSDQNTVYSILIFIGLIYFSGNLIAQPGGDYTCQTLPTVNFEHGVINNKRQVAGKLHTQEGTKLYLWLPYSDYELEAGVHIYDIPTDLPGTTSFTLHANSWLEVARIISDSESEVSLSDPSPPAGTVFYRITGRSL